MDIERLKWVVEFANRDLTTMREGDWLNLRDDLRELIRQPISGIEIRVTGKGVLEHHEQIAELQGEARTFFRRIAENNMKLADKRPGSKAISIPDWEVKIKFGPCFSFQSFLRSSSEPIHRKIPAAGIFAWSEDVSGIKFAVVLLLAGLHDNLRLCPECDAIFYRVRKQKYCSKTCINRVSRRDWLKDPKNQEKESDWAHQRYERRAKAMKGPKIKVQRRKRGQ